MKALVFDRFGGPEVLCWREIPDPSPSATQAVVRMKSVGLNLADVYRRNGTYHLAGEPPWILGYEGAGVVECAARSDSRDSRFPAGTRVAFADSPFANAELVAVDVDRLITLPADVEFDVAASVLLQGLTAQYLVRDSFAVGPGHVAVVHAAAGGVGQLLTQMLKAAGALVVGVASTEDKRRAVLAAGADLAVDYAEMRAKTKELSGGRGADVVYDSVGRTLGESLATARTGGAVVFYGMAAGDPDPVDPRTLMDRSLTLTGGDLWNVLTSAEIRAARAVELFDMIRSASLTVRVARRFLLRDGAEAHRYLESRQAIGKVLLTV
jgi:NADPH2:quinone reductase